MRYKSGDMWNEQVWFIPDENIRCRPPYEKGKIDNCWVKYKKRPKTLEQWQDLIGIKILAVIK